MKKKILFVNGHLQVGGVENSLINVLKNIDYINYEVDLVLFEELGDYANEVPKEVNIIFYDLTKTYGSLKQCIIYGIKSKKWFAILLRLIFLLEKILKIKTLFLAKPFFKLHKKYDCAIAYRPGICTDFVRYIVDSKKKITWWHHGTYDYTKYETKQWMKVLSKFDHLIAVSESCKDMLTTNIPELKSKILTIPNIINLKEINNKSNEIINYDAFSEKGVTLLSVGRLSPEKGMINCVYTCKKLVDNGYMVKWFLIGEGQERNIIESLIEKYKLNDHIYLLGSLSNPYPYIKNATLYVHPSLVESLSISVLEAMALNTPVIVARSMGPAEFIRHNENGLLVEPCPEGLFQGIVTLIENKKVYEQLKKDKSDALIQYSPPEIMQKIYGLVEVN